MNKWLKYIIISIFLFIGMNSVKAEESYATYNYDFYKGESKIEGMEIKCYVYKETEQVICKHQSNFDKQEHRGELPFELFYDENGVKKPDSFNIFEKYDISASYLNYIISNEEIPFPEECSSTMITCSYYTAKFNGIMSTYEGNSSSDNSNNYINGCEDLGETATLLRQIYNIIRYLIPILIIILSIIDFLQVVLFGEEKSYKGAWTKFIKRIVVGVVILILPQLLSFIIGISGVLDNYNIDPNNIFCILR